MPKSLYGGIGALVFVLMASAWLGGCWPAGGPPAAVRDARALTDTARALHLGSIGFFKPPTADGDLNTRALDVEETTEHMETVSAQGLALALRDWDAANSDMSRKIAAMKVHGAIAKLREMAGALDSGPPPVITHRAELLKVLEQIEKDVP